MTAIAAFLASNIAVVFGDLMLSSRDEEVTAAHLPAAGDVSGHVTKDGYSFAGLSQKVVLISDRCAIAWAGSYMSAGLLIQELRRLAQTSELTVEEIHRFLRDHPHGDHVAMVGWIWQDSGLYPINHSAHAFEVEGLGRVVLGGSGLPTLLETLRRLRTSETRSDGPLDHAGAALAMAAVLSGSLLQRELYGRDMAAKLDQVFGGAFEAAFLFGKAFVKVGDITFVFWEAKVQEGGIVNFQTPLLFLKQAYLDDFLLIKSGRFQYDVETGRIRGLRHAYAVPPMYMTKDEVSELSARVLSFQSPYFLHIFFAYDTEANDEWYYANFTSAGDAAVDPSIKFEESDKGLTWTASEAFIASATREILASRTAGGLMQATASRTL